MKIKMPVPIELIVVRNLHIHQHISIWRSKMKIKMPVPIELIVVRNLHIHQHISIWRSKEKITMPVPIELIVVRNCIFINAYQKGPRRRSQCLSLLDLWWREITFSLTHRHFCRHDFFGWYFSNLNIFGEISNSECQAEPYYQPVQEYFLCFYVCDYPPKEWTLNRLTDGLCSIVWEDMSISQANRFTIFFFDFRWF